MTRFSARKGFTLIELIFVIAAVSVVLTVSATLLCATLDLNGQIRETSERTQSTDRLVADFRKDVRNLGKPEIVPLADDAEGVLLRWPTVAYEIYGEESTGRRSVRRSERTDGTITRIEDYRLPDDTVLRFSEGKDKHAGQVALSLWRRVPGSDIPSADEENPFDRTLASGDGSAYIGIWRTVLARAKGGSL